MRFNYFSFLATYGREPEDFVDLFAGLAAAGVRNEIEEYRWQRRLAASGQA